jgi:hypothetical protein
MGATHCMESVASVHGAAVNRGLDCLSVCVPTASLLSKFQFLGRNSSICLFLWFWSLPSVAFPRNPTKYSRTYRDEQVNAEQVYHTTIRIGIACDLTGSPARYPRPPKHKIFGSCRFLHTTAPRNNYTCCGFLSERSSCSHGFDGGHEHNSSRECRCSPNCRQRRCSCIFFGL